MSYVQWKITRYAFTGTGWSGSGTVISDAYDPMISVALGDKKDTFSFKLNNAYDRWDNYFQPNDKVEISRVTNTTVFAADDIKMVGIVRKIPAEASGVQNELRIEGYNYSESVATGIVFINPLNKNPMEIVSAAVDNLRLNNSNFTVTYSNTNPTTKKNGTAFPTYSQKYFYKPLSKVLEEQLSDAYTQDGAYFWWVDKDAKLQIRADTAGSVHTYNSETDLVTVSYKEDRDTSQVRNYVIIKGGTDPAGLPIQTRVSDTSSITKHGMKFYFMVSNKKYAESLNQEDMVKSWGTSQATSRYPTSYPFTTSWYASYTDTIESVSVVAGSQVTVNSDAQYSAVLRQEVITKLKADAQQVIDGTKFGKLKVDIATNAGSKAWILGDRISCTIPKIGAVNKLLRVKEIQYTTEIDTFSLEEDIGTI